MKPQKLSLEAIKKAHTELTDIFEKKNKDYGNSFEESLEKHGIIAAIVRMEDKMLRLSNLSKNQSEQLVKDESIIDTLKDLSNYALMTAVWLEQTQLVKEVDDKITSYKEVPFVKDNNEFDMSYFDGYGSKFKSIIQDIMKFDPEIIVKETITLNNRVKPKMVQFDVMNMDRFIIWFRNYLNNENYLLNYHYGEDLHSIGRVQIALKKDNSNV